VSGNERIVAGINVGCPGLYGDAEKWFGGWCVDPGGGGALGRIFGGMDIGSIPTPEASADEDLGVEPAPVVAAIGYVPDPISLVFNLAPASTPSTVERPILQAESALNTVIEPIGDASPYVAPYVPPDDYVAPIVDLVGDYEQGYTLFSPVSLVGDQVIRVESPDVFAVDFSTTPDALATWLAYVAP